MNVIAVILFIVLCLVASSLLVIKPENEEPYVYVVLEYICVACLLKSPSIGGLRNFFVTINSRRNLDSINGCLSGRNSRYFGILYRSCRK